MRYVFVETNWVVAYAAPAHMRLSAAIELLERASQGEFQLLLPSICISEARNAILTKFQVRSTADQVRRFLLWGKEQTLISPQDEENARVIMDRMESAVRDDLSRLPETLGKLKGRAGLEIFDLSQEMLERCSDLSFEKLDLKPFDQAILSAILVRAEQLVKGGENDLAFCELDGDLQPWNKLRERRSDLADLYDKVRVWVYGDFLFQTPPIPKGWPPAAS